MTTSKSLITTICIPHSIILVLIIYSAVAPYNVSIAGSNAYNYGDQLELNCLSEGGPDIRYSWRKNGADECLSNTNTLATVLAI